MINDIAACVRRGNVHRNLHWLRKGIGFVPSYVANGAVGGCLDEFGLHARANHDMDYGRTHVTHVDHYSRRHGNGGHVLRSFGHLLATDGLGREPGLGSPIPNGSSSSNRAVATAGHTRRRTTSRSWGSMSWPCSTRSYRTTATASIFCRRYCRVGEESRLPSVTSTSATASWHPGGGTMGLWNSNCGLLWMSRQRCASIRQVAIS
jgi:hypothetical protein